jgi:hypothetical protein
VTETSGYVRKKTYSLYFTDEQFEGLAIEARSGTVDEFAEVGSLLTTDVDSMKESLANVKAAHDIIFPKLQRWNLQDEDGTPIPLTREAFDEQDKEFVEGIVYAWRRAVAGVRPALKEKSDSGALSAAESIPMETLPESPES